ncbi:helix-turn-helix transcriptional regulator [Acetobacter malorum]|uniref:helix-turn-helix transcriptional regulator n=1 Tax=Acetobacter malorum TaxID=178901 RepID=UPI0039ED25FC
MRRIIVEESKLLSLDEVAHLARVTSRTMRKYLSENKGPVMTRIGGRVFVRRDHFESWLASCAVSQNAS